MWTRPEPGEGPDYYLAAAARVPDGNLPETALAEMRTLRARLADLSDGEADRAYAPGKWSVKEVVGHLSDVERVMAFRMLHFARRDPAALPGMDQDPWSEAARHGTRSLRSLLDELGTVRAATASLLQSFGAAELGAWGEASGMRFTVRALAWFTLGHAVHHRRILEKRYLGSAVLQSGAGGAPTTT